MRKFTTIALLAALVLCLAACSRGGASASQPAPTEAPAGTAEPTATPSSDVLAKLAASDTDAAVAKTQTPPASNTDLEVDGEAYEKAKACEGLTIFDLYAAIGQPAETPTYGPSCLQENAQDGMLRYKGFYVWTVRTDTEEIVHQVSLDEGE